MISKETVFSGYDCLADCIIKVSCNNSSTKITACHSRSLPLETIFKQHPLVSTNHRSSFVIMLQNRFRILGNIETKQILEQKFS